MAWVTSLSRNALNDMIFHFLNASATFFVNSCTSVCVDNKIVSIMIDVNILREDHDLVDITENGCNLFEWDSLGFGEIEECYNPTKSGDDDENEEEFPADVRERSGGTCR